MPPIKPEILDLTALRALADELANQVDKLSKEYHEKFRLSINREGEPIKKIERRWKRVHNKQLKVQGVLRDRLVEHAHIEAETLIQEFKENIVKILSSEGTLGPKSE